MQAKEFMQQVETAKKKLKMVAAMRDHYVDMMNSIGAKVNTVVVTKSGNTSKTETVAIGLAELTQQLAEEEQELTALIVKARGLIDKIPQEKFREVLTLKYLCGWSWRSIMDELEYKDEKSAYRCHGYALKELQKVM